MTIDPARSGPRFIAGNILVYFLGALLVGSALAKFAQVPMVMTQMSALGFAGGRLMFIGILELISAVLFLIPRTRPAGFLLVTAYLGGAIATHVGHGQPQAIQPAFLLALFWFAAWLRHPQFLWNLSPSE
jgi:DoxX-like protein